MRCPPLPKDMGSGAVTTLEAIEETLEVLSQLQLNGTVTMEDSDKVSQCIQHLHSIRYNLKIKDNEYV